MRKILLPVDGSPCSDRAVKFAITLAQGCPSAEILLLNVQAPVESWEVRRFLKAEEIEAMEESKGGDQLASARALLNGAGVRHTPEVAIGPVAETIARIARERGCDTVVMGTRGMGAVAGAVLGSVSTEVVHRSDVPVTLVK